MAADGLIGNGCKVGFSASNSPLSYTTVPHVYDLDIPGVTIPRVDNTIHGGPFHREMPGLPKVTEMKFILQGDGDAATSAAQGTLESNYGQYYYWRAEVPTNRARTTFLPYTFRGWVADVKRIAPIEDRQTFECTVVFDGDSFTVGTSGATALS